MEVDELPNINVNELKNEISSEKTQTRLAPTARTDLATEQTPHNGDVMTVVTLEYPPATSSKTKYNSGSTDKEKKEIQEFFRVLRPHLPRKSKSKAYKMLQNIAKGIVVQSSFQSKIKKTKLKKRPVRKEKTRRLKTKSLSAVRRNDRSLYGSSDSCRSNLSCPHCGHSCCRLNRC